MELLSFLCVMVLSLSFTSSVGVNICAFYIEKKKNPNKPSVEQTHR